MIHIPHIQRVIREVLTGIDMWSREAEALMLGTGAVESNYTYLRQLGGGPAHSFWQIEPATSLDNMDTFLVYRPERWKQVSRCCVLPQSIMQESLTEHRMAHILASNMYFACAMARIKYWRVPVKLPREDDYLGMAKYHKKYYNTTKGKTNINESAKIFEQTIRRNQ